MHAAATVFDQTPLLQGVGDERHAWAPNAQHLREKFLGQRKIVAASEVAHIEQPAAHAGLNRVTGVTRRGLLRLCEQHLLMPNEERAEGLDFIGQPAQPVDLYGARAAGNLHDALVEGHLAVERRGRVQDAVVAHHRRLDHHAHIQIDHQRDCAGIRKVDLPNRAASFGKYIAKLQFDDFQVR